MSRPTEADRTLADADADDEFLVDIFRRETSPENVADDAVDASDNVDPDDWPEIKVRVFLLNVRVELNLSHYCTLS